MADPTKLQIDVIIQSAQALSKINKLNKSVDSLSGTMKQADTSTAKLNQSTKQLNPAVRALSDQANRMRASLAVLSASGEATEKDFINLKTESSLLAERINELGKRSGLTVKEMNALGAAANKTASVNRNVNNSLSTLTNQVTTVGHGFGGTTNAAINLNRVIQDLPYGIMGVANNMEGALFSIRAVTAGTTGLTAGIKAVAAAMFTGPGALLTAITVIPTALIMLQRHLGKAKDGVGELKDVVDSAVSAFRDLENAANDVLFGDTISNQIAESEKNVERFNQIIDSLQKKLEESEQRAIRSGNVFTVPFKAIASYFNTIGDEAEKYEEILKGFQEARLKEQAKINGLKIIEKEETSAIAEQERLAAMMLEQRAKEAEAYVDRMLKYQQLLKDMRISPSRIMRGQAVEPASDIDAGFNVNADLYNPDQLKAFTQANQDIVDGFKMVKASAVDTFGFLADVNTSQVFVDYTNAMTNSLMSLADGFGQIVAGASRPFDILLGIVADFAGQLGRYTVGIGVAQLAIKKSFANPAAAIAAGTALIALSGAVRSMTANYGGGASAASGALSSRAITPNQNQLSANLYINGRQLQTEQQFTNLRSNQLGF